MGTPRYPTREGIAIPTEEIWLPQSYSERGNNHHCEWQARRFGKSILFLVFRNMDSHQEFLPIDQHDWLHFHYDEPKFPTPIQAMNEIERGFWEQEQLKVREKGGYVFKELDKSILDLCKQDYERYK